MLASSYFSLSCWPWTTGVQHSKLPCDGRIERIFWIRGDHSVTSEESHRKISPVEQARRSLRGALKAINHTLGSGSRTVQ